jgi:hypothetical protein
MDLQEICQLTIDLRTLDKYFHIEELPERKPLLILKNEYVESEPSLVKFGESVQYVSRNELKNKPRPYLEFSKIEVDENAAHVEFLYPSEGIAGRVKFFKNALGWHIEAHHIAER